jgi:nitroreductase
MERDRLGIDVREAFLQAMRFRHACRFFDRQRRVSREDIDFLLEAARLSPSSFGLEPWRFIVVEAAELKAGLQKACTDEPQVGSASAVIVIFARMAELAADAEYVKRMLRRETTSPAEFATLLNDYREFVRQNDLTAWSIAQCHVAAANMMTAGALVGIDTCPIGAFSSAAALEALAIPGRGDVVALLLALGYRKDAAPPKQRLPLSELVEYR